jgi:hypothetical protein
MSDGAERAEGRVALTFGSALPGDLGSTQTSVRPPLYTGAASATAATDA